MDQGTWNMLGDYNKYEHSHEELEHLKAKLQMFSDLLNDPVAQRFFIIKYIRDEFKKEFGQYVTMPEV